MVVRTSSGMCSADGANGSRVPAGIGFSAGARDPQVLTVELDAVPVKKLQSLPDQLLDSLHTISGQPIDMERMRSVIQSTRLSVRSAALLHRIARLTKTSKSQLLRSVETSASDYLCETISSGA